MATSPLHRLQELGQSVWYDNIRRALLDSGRLREYLDEYAVTGVTSNPSIFERAIAGSTDYDDQLCADLEDGLEDPEELFWSLAVRDIRDTADLLQKIYDDSDGADGFVSRCPAPRPGSVRSRS